MLGPADHMIVVVLVTVAKGVATIINFLGFFLFFV